MSGLSGPGEIPSSRKWREGHRLELLVLCCWEAVLHRLLQLVLALLRTPLGYITVDDEACCHPIGLAHCHWGGRGETHDHMTGFFLKTQLNIDYYYTCFVFNLDAVFPSWKPADVTWRVETSSTWRHLQGSLCFTQFFHSVQELSTSGLLQGVACKHARQQVDAKRGWIIRWILGKKKSKDQVLLCFFLTDSVHEVQLCVCWVNNCLNFYCPDFAHFTLC